MARVLVKDIATELSTDIGIVTIPGEVKAYAGTTAPAGFLFCHGQAVSRTTYADLFTVLGTSHGSGDGSTTFNLPDYRGQFLRGRVNVTSASGSGTVAASATQATFAAHGFNRTGFKVRLSANFGNLLANTDYYIRVVDDNTLAFCSSLANAISNTRLTITGSVLTNTMVVNQFEDPDASSRLAPAGGVSGNNIGAMQDSSIKSHDHKTDGTEGSSTHAVRAGVDAPIDWRSLIANANDAFYATGSKTGVTGGNETRPSNSLINYIIKF